MRLATAILALVTAAVMAHPAQGAAAESEAGESRFMHGKPMPRAVVAHAHMADSGIRLNDQPRRLSADDHREIERPHTSTGQTSSSSSSSSSPSPHAPLTSTAMRQGREAPSKDPLGEWSIPGLWSTKPGWPLGLTDVALAAKYTGPSSSSSSSSSGSGRFRIPSPYPINAASLFSVSRAIERSADASGIDWRAAAAPVRAAAGARRRPRFSSSEPFVPSLDAIVEEAGRPGPGRQHSSV